jgi:hypothetical protein
MVLVLVIESVLSVEHRLTTEYEHEHEYENRVNSARIVGNDEASGLWGSQSAPNNWGQITPHNWDNCATVRCLQLGQLCDSLDSDNWDNGATV